MGAIFTPFAEVSVLSNSSFGKDTYTYKIPGPLLSNLQPGHLVKVPFGPKILKGFVIKRSPSTAYPTKEIIGLIRPFPLLTPKQLTLASWMSKYYYSPLSLVLKHFNLDAYPSELNQNTYPDIAQKLTLIPAPNYQELPQTNCPIFHHNLTAKIKQQIWSDVYSGKTALIMGTRSSLFLPFRNLKEIEVYAGESKFYEERQAPYYHAVQLTSLIAKLFNTAITVKYSIEFQKELTERKLLGYPPSSDLLCLSPVKTAKKDHIIAQDLILSLKESVNRHNTQVDIFKTEESGKIKIFLKGKNIHPLLQNLPKGWRVRIYYFNVNV